MPSEPQIQALPTRRRAWFFWTLVLIFAAALPTVIFYTTGYRLSFENDATSIVTTGGMYLDTIDTNVEVYLDEEQFTRPRLFQSAYYLQNIAAGQHRVVVQANGLHTWVKDLPVDEYVVTEAATFNVPVTPQLRPITEYVTEAGVAVYQVATTTNAAGIIFGSATSTELFTLSTSSSVAIFEDNPEYEFISTLFASSATSTASVFADNAPEERFGFSELSLATTSATTSTTVIEIIERNDIRLIDRGWEVYALWEGDDRDIPYFFCVNQSSRASTSARYGEHVAEAIYSMLGTTTASSTVFEQDERICRTEIKLDHLQQDVYGYNFFPGSAGQVVLHLQDGLYVTEIDDRAWQNTQPLLLGSDVLVVFENDQIYIQRGEYFFELITELDT